MVRDSLEFRFVEVQSQLLAAPKVFEVSGGAEDGEEGYPFYSVQVQELGEAFDEVLEISWSTMHDELYVAGRIGGEDAWVTSEKHPFEDARGTDVLDAGILRPKRETP